MHPLLFTFPLLLCTACDTQRHEPPAPPAQAQACRTIDGGTALPGEVRETSGLAVSSDATVLWTHNDRGHDPVLYAVADNGGLHSTVVVTGTEPVDWEDIEAAPCASGRCLYIADIGDNDQVRAHITIYEITEPGPDDDRAGARAMRARYPDGARNAEAMFMLPGGDVYIVTKGDDSAPALYRFPAHMRARENVVLERVRGPMAQPQQRRDYITGAAATPDGRWVAIRTYGALHIYAAADLLSGTGRASITVDLSPLGEPQGEGVAIADDGTVWLSSEAEGGGAAPRLARLSCTLPD
ncbi:MAG TPA: hypothetical protein VK912_15270 [Longimicrobiales bacterium]|nr:hypothetical protein [Longimicrobiales bacterium]